MRKPPLIAERYLLGEMIGAGGMGRVYRAVDTRTGEVVAVKQLKLTHAGRDPPMSERFRREGEALRRLNHPNIVRVLATVEQDGVAHLVMEYADGGSLEDLLLATDRPLPIDRVLQIALDLSDALIRTHRLDIVHRDLKPGNVLLAGDGTPRLTDFGSAYVKGEDRLTRASAIIGTIEYLSPESLRGEESDPRADIWSFGVLLFEMLTRRRPFAHDSVPQTLHSIIFSSPPDLTALRPDCPPRLVNLVYRMLAKNPSERVSSARQLSAELDAILHGRATPTVMTPPPAEAADPRVATLRSNVPSSTKTFIGRQAELRQLERSLRDVDTRLITIVAPGGMGKTRLMIELGTRLVAAALTDAPPFRFCHGIFFVELAPLGSADLLVSAIAEAVGVPAYVGRDPKQQLFDYFREKQTLLLLDNFEHVLDGAPVVSELLRAARGLNIVATSRERLGLSVETLFTLEGMELPESASAEAVDTPALRLFAQGAGRPLLLDVGQDPHAVDDVVRICRLVEGVPLGIVLAATWADTLSFREIADEISRSLDFLAAELRDLPERQRSMRAVFDHSWALLNERERHVLSAISVFRGGFTREAAQAVTGADVQTLGGLVRKSLLRRQPETGRFDVHELLRQYAENQLGTLPGRFASVLASRSDYFARYLQARERVLQGPNPREALRELELELDNIRASWAHMVQEWDLERLAACLETLNLFHTLRASFVEGEAAFGTLVARFSATAQFADNEHRRILGRAASLRAMFLRQQGRYAQAEQLLDEALSTLDEKAHPRERAFALVGAGNTMTKTGKLQQGLRLAEEGVALYRSTNDAWGLANALETVGRIYGTSGDFGSSERAFRESTIVQRAAGLMQSGLMGLAVAMVQQGSYATGCSMMRDALDMFDRAGDIWNKMRCQMNLANVQRNLGNYGSAEALATSCLLFWQEVGNWDHEAWCYFQLGNIAKEQAQYERAAEMYALARARSVQTGDAGKIALASLEFGGLSLSRHDYAEARRQILESLAGFESAGQAWGTALALDSLGWLECEERNFDAAKADLAKALSISLGLRLFPFAMNVLAGIAFLFARAGSRERALEFVALVQSNPATERHTLARRIAPLLSELRASVSAELFERALARGRTLDLSSTAGRLQDAAQGWA